MRMNKRAILAKIETTYGTDSVPTGAANAILTRGIKFHPLKMNMDQRNLIRPYFANFEEIPGSAFGEFEIEVEVQGSGAAGTAPSFGVLLRACAHSETITPSVRVEYSPISDAEEALSCYYYKDGNLYKLLGVKGNVMLELTAQKILVWKFKFIGLRQAVGVAALPSVTLTGFKKPLAVNKANTQFTLHGFAAALESLSFDAATQMPYVNRPNREAVDFTGRQSSGQVVIEEPLQSAIDFYDRAYQVTTGALSLTHGTAAGLRFKMDAAAVQVGEPDESEVNNVAMIGMPLRFMPTAGNDEYKFTFD
jgi:hypothetical protein